MLKFLIPMRRHICELCERYLYEKKSEILDNLESPEDSIPKSVMSFLCYIAGYVFRDAKEDAEDDTYIINTVVI